MSEIFVLAGHQETISRERVLMELETTTERVL